MPSTTMEAAVALTSSTEDDHGLNLHTLTLKDLTMDDTEEYADILGISFATKTTTMAMDEDKQDDGNSSSATTTSSSVFIL